MRGVGGTHSVVVLPDFTSWTVPGLSCVSRCWDSRPQRSWFRKTPATASFNFLMLAGASCRRLCRRPRTRSCRSSSMMRQTTPAASCRTTRCLSIRRYPTSSRRPPQRPSRWASSSCARSTPPTPSSPPSRTASRTGAPRAPPPQRAPSVAMLLSAQSCPRCPPWSMDL